MITQPHVLAAIDFSEGSRTALRYAASFARLLDAPLTAVTVTDAVVEEAAGALGDWASTQAARELAQFCEQTLGEEAAVRLSVRVGAPAQEILQCATEVRASLLVMGTQGLTGVRKMFFGSTTERVLRDATMPVLVTPPGSYLPPSHDDLGLLIRRVLVAVDLTRDASAEVRTARALGRAIGTPLTLMHVVEPLSVPTKWRAPICSIEIERRDRAEALLQTVRLMYAPDNSDGIVTTGEPSEEIAQACEARGAGLIVTGLQVSGQGRVGTVTYRVLSMARVPVLALPVGAAFEFAACLKERRRFCPVRCRQ